MLHYRPFEELLRAASHDDRAIEPEREAPWTPAVVSTGKSMPDTIDVSAELRTWKYILHCAHKKDIAIDPAWKITSGGFRSFLLHVGRQPSALHQIVRIDPARGYVPGNVEWRQGNAEVATTRDPAPSPKTKVSSVSTTPEYQAWSNTRHACLFPQNKNYPSIGGLGIRMHPEWLGREGFFRFLAYVGHRPSPHHKLLRLDPMKDFAPGNVGWELAKYTPPKSYARSPEYKQWEGMIALCYHPPTRGYAKLGGKGVGVHDSWRGLDGYKNFIRDMGSMPEPGLRVHRIDPTKNFGPGNCEWNTRRG